MKVYLMYANKNFELEENRPKNEAILQSDLELDVLFQAMAKDDEFLYIVAKNAVMDRLHSIEEIRYRQEVLKDCLKNPNIIKNIYRLTLETIKKKHDKWLSIFGKYPSSLLSSSVALLDMYFEILEDLKKIADENIDKFNSDGFKRFFKEMQKELSKEYVNTVKEYLEDLKFKKGVLISATLDTVTVSRDYILRQDKRFCKNWIGKVFTKKPKSYEYELHPRDDAGANILRNIKDESLNNIAKSLCETANNVDSFFNALKKEIAFYIGCLNLYEKLNALDEPISFADIFPKNLRVLQAQGLYDVSLALTMNKKVIGNEIQADGKELCFITGANQGGKSTFLRSIGLADVMVHSGMFVPAESLKTNLCNEIFTHFKKEEDKSVKSGKFDEELKRMSDIVDLIKPYSMICFNESFASTNEKEGSAIAEQIINALLEKNIKVFFVTHMYELANNFYKKEKKNFIFLRANREEKGIRNFKIIEAKPLKTSFGKDLYQNIFFEKESIL